MLTSASYAMSAGPLGLQVGRAGAGVLMQGQGAGDFLT